jgi:hypothetical protein
VVPVTERREAALCGACETRQVRLRWADGESEDQGRQRVARCQACGHQPSTEVFRENRLSDLLPAPDEWPTPSGVRWSENLTGKPDGADGAVLLVLGSHEWDSLTSRTTLEFADASVGADLTVVKGRGPGVGFTHDDGDIGHVTIHLPGPALRSLQETGRWTASVPDVLAPIHLVVEVRADV